MLLLLSRYYFHHQFSCCGRGAVVWRWRPRITFTGSHVILLGSADVGGAARGGGALLQFLPGRAHGRYLLAGQGLEGLRYQVRVRHHHLLPARRLHHVRHVPRVDELNCLQIIGI